MARRKQRSEVSKETIEDCFYAPTSKRSYSTYQRQFFEYCRVHKNGLDPKIAQPSDCSDFFHYLYSEGEKTARTVDSAKSALVAFFNKNEIKPNPAQDIKARNYVKSLQKYNRQNNIDEEKKAHPVTVHELSIIMNSFAIYPMFIGSMYRFLFSACFIGCFRISEMLNLTWDDIALKQDENFSYVSIRLRWHKKASVQDDCQVYSLVDEESYPCLRVCSMFNDYKRLVRSLSCNLSTNAFVFPRVALLRTGQVRVDWYNNLEQNQVRLLLKDVVHKNTDLSTGISLHSMRRGGCFYRTFESPERKFNFRELMAWCRWEDAKTCIEYLVTKELSDAIDPRNLLRTNRVCDVNIQSESNDDEKIKRLVKLVVEEMDANQTQAQAELTPVDATCSNTKSPRSHTKSSRSQLSMNQFIQLVNIPTARSAREAWDQWFSGDPEKGLFQSLSKFTPDMIRVDRRKYSERSTLAQAFVKYNSYETFAAAYGEHTVSFTKILKEVRKRKREDKL
jgi:integrase